MKDGPLRSGLALWGRRINYSRHFGSRRHSQSKIYRYNSRVQIQHEWLQYATVSIKRLCINLVEYVSSSFATYRVSCPVLLSQKKI